MVTIKEIRQSNAALRARDPGQVILVTGATSGIGETTLIQIAIHMNAPRVIWWEEMKEPDDEFWRR